ADPTRVVGMHFFNPAPVLPLVEVIRGQKTSPEAFDTAYAFGERIGKDPIGIDVHVHVCEALWNAYREPKFAPPPRLVRMTKAGLLGRKSGEGFYRYDR